MTERSERFRARRAKLNASAENAIVPIADAELVNAMLSQEVDRSLIDFLAVEPPVFNQRVTEEEITRCLSELDEQFTEQKYDALFKGVEDTLIDQLLGPFGLSRSALMEKDRKFVYQDVKEEYGTGFRSTRKQEMKKSRDESGRVRDAYTGKPLEENKIDVDHIIPKKKAHNNRGGFMLSADEKAAWGNDPNNLAPTHRSTNRSKGSNDLLDQEGLDGRRTKPAQARAEKSISDHMPRGLEFGKRAATDGVKMGAKQGMQQALALIFSEFLSAIFSEVKDIFSNGWKGGEYDARWINSLKKRINRIKSRLLNRWKDVAQAFGEGTLSGFLSATSTALLNMFIRTSRNVVRILREGFLSITKAIRVLLFPPEDMSLREAAHEASKVLTTGLVVTGGVLAGEAIAQKLGSMPFSDVLGGVVGGLISGLGSLLVVFMLDKLDLFGVAFDERHAFIMGILDDRISKTTKEFDRIASDIGLRGSERPP